MRIIMSGDSRDDDEDEDDDIVACVSTDRQTDRQMLFCVVQTRNSSSNLVWFAPGLLAKLRKRKNLETTKKETTDKRRKQQTAF